MKSLLQYHHRKIYVGNCNYTANKKFINFIDKFINCNAHTKFIYLLHELLTKIQQRKYKMKSDIHELCEDS